MVTYAALLFCNLIGWSSGRIAPSCPIDSAAKLDCKCTLTKVVPKFSGIFGSYKTREHAFDKTRKQLFREILGEFPDNFRKI